MAKSSQNAKPRSERGNPGNRKIELVLDAQELDMLARNCAARRLVVIRTKWPSTSRC
jgi:hypothetical protein